jgi:hypothetical protein
VAIEVSVGHAQAFALHPFEGVGAQFNVNVFTPDGQPRPLTQPQHDALGRRSRTSSQADRARPRLRRRAKVIAPTAGAISSSAPAERRRARYA